MSPLRVFDVYLKIAKSCSFKRHPCNEDSQTIGCLLLTDHIYDIVDSLVQIVSEDPTLCIRSGFLLPCHIEVMFQRAQVVTACSSFSKRILKTVLFHYQLIKPCTTV